MDLIRELEKEAHTQEAEHRQGVNQSYRP